MMIRRFALLSILVLGATGAPARAEQDIVVDKHRPWETQAGDYCGRNPMSMRTLTAQVISIERCVSNFDTGEVRFHERAGRTIAKWPIRGEVTRKIIGFCSCTVRD